MDVTIKYTYKETRFEIHITHEFKEYAFRIRKAPDKMPREWVEIDTYLNTEKRIGEIPKSYVDLIFKENYKPLFEKEIHRSLCIRKENPNRAILETVGKNIEKFL